MRTVHWGGWAALTAGAALCAIGWYGVAGTERVAHQLSYLASCTVPGAALVVAGAVLLSRSEQSRTAEQVADLHRLFLTYDEPYGWPEAYGSPGPYDASGPYGSAAPEAVHQPDRTGSQNRPAADAAAGPADARDHSLAAGESGPGRPGAREGA
ncbi:hypothetical protein, partial [Streptomyces lycii]